MIRRIVKKTEKRGNVKYKHNPEIFTLTFNLLFMNITIIGNGNVSLVSGVCLAEMVKQFHYKTAKISKDGIHRFENWYLELYGQ